MAEAIEFEVRADTEDAAEAFDRLTGKLQGMERGLEEADKAAGNLDLKKPATEARQLAAATDDVARALKNKNRNMGLAVNELTEFVGGVTMAIPGTGMLASQIQAAGNNVVGLSAALGPAGIAIGLIAGILPAVIALFRDTSDEVDQYTGATERATDATRRFTEALEQANASRRASRVGAGVGSVEDVQAELDVVEERLAAVRLAESQAISGGATQEQLAAYRQAVDGFSEQRQRLLREYEQAVQDRNAFELEQNDIALSDSSSSRRGRSSSPRRADPSRERSALGREVLGFLDRELSIEESLAELRAADLMREQERAKLAQSVVDAKQAEAEADRQRVEDMERGLRLAEQQEQTFANTSQVTDAIGNSLNATFQAALQGEKNLGKALLDALKVELANIATRNLFLGLERIATGVATRDPAQFVSAAQHFAVAAAAGAAAGGIAAAQGGGNAQRGGGSTREPERNQGDSGGGGGGTTIINFNQPATEAQQGRQFKQANRAATRRGL